ncbi:DUF7504 family protein [Halorussus halobius]|uniref:DUF7504 family protein n=1 Tax=Halorussus halobius TaxID=1710537 RepID=UPI0010931EC5|nr:hypothetical protein [Halorussus halobius]
MQDTRLVRTSVAGNPHTLVLRRTSDGAREFEPLFDLLPADGPNDVLAVTHEQSTRFLRRWGERIDRRPRNVGVVSVGEVMRSTSAVDVASRRPVRGVADPTDAEEIRDAATGYLDAWPDEGRTVAYVDSATAVVDDLGVERGVEFLRTFRRALDARDAVGYVCLAPTAHDRTVVREVASLFDTVIECVDNEAETAATPSVGDCFEAMSDRRRRGVLAVLADEGPLPVDDLADRVAARTRVDRDRVLASLIDVHLPKLAALGLAAYDRERVARGEHFERVEPYLGRTVERDRPARGDCPVAEE